MLLNRTHKLAIVAVTTAVSSLFIWLTRVLPFGMMLAFMIAGVMLYFACKVCGFRFGLLGYVATSLLALLALPNGFCYILLFGPHALLKFGLAKWAKGKSLAIGAVCYLILFVFFNAAFLGVFTLAGQTLGLSAITEKISNRFLLSLLFSLPFLFYNFVLGKLIGYVVAVFNKMTGTAKSAAKSAVGAVQKKYGDARKRGKDKKAAKAKKKAGTAPDESSASPSGETQNRDGTDGQDTDSDQPSGAPEKASGQKNGGAEPLADVGKDGATEKQPPVDPFDFFYHDDKKI